MSSKNKKRPDRVTRTAANAPREEVERLIAKERLKDAVKQAKICFRDDPTPEHHQLLERVYFLRANQLLADAMPTSAKEVAYHLLDFGVTDAGLLEQVTRLLISVGLSREAKAFQGRIESPEVLERLALEEADLAVVHPGRASSATDEIRQGGQTIRAAIEAIQNGDDDEAKGLEVLRNIARGSPFADWKLFARGLAAHHRGDEAETKANWDRLNPARAAARIASALRKLAEPSRPPSPAGEKGISHIEALERRVFGVQVLEPLGQLASFLADGRWDKVVRQIGVVRQLLARIDPALPERLTRVFYSLLIRESRDLDFDDATALVRDFTRAAQPLSNDPRWNKLWALIREGNRGDLEEADAYWRSYLDDLETLPSLNQDERLLARALVLNHLGKEHVEEAEACGPSPKGKFPTEGHRHEYESERNRAIACFEASMKLAPGHSPTYHALIKTYKNWDRPDDAAAVARRLLKSFPNDFDGLVFLFDHHFRRQEPDLALQYAQRARTLKPLDQTTIDNEWAVHILRARELALKSHWDEGRAEFEAAAQLRPDLVTTLHVQARRAVFEFKAGQAERSATLIADALKSLPEAAAFWLALLIEAIRYKLPKAERDRFDTHWTAEHSQKVTSETAGALAKLMAPFLANKIEYKGSVGHINQVVAYLKRTTKIKYAHDDLVKVCEFLILLDKQKTLLGQLVKRGLKLFPNSPAFLLFSASLELSKGPSGGGNFRLAQYQLKMALERAEASSDPSHTVLLPEIRGKLSKIEDLVSSAMPFLFGGFGGNPFAGAARMGGFGKALEDMMGRMFDDEDDDEWDDDEWDDDEWDDAPVNLPVPLPLPRAAETGPKKSKPKSKSKPKKKG